MAIYRVDVLIDDPNPVFDWLDERVPRNLMVRRIAYKTAKGWYVKAVFKRQTDANSFTFAGFLTPVIMRLLLLRLGPCRRDVRHYNSLDRSGGSPNTVMRDE